MKPEAKNQLDTISNYSDALSLFKEFIPEEIFNDRRDWICAIVRRMYQIGYIEGKSFEKHRIKTVLDI